MVIVLVGQPSLSAADALAVGQHTGIVNTMRTYKDDEHGYEIDIPEDWSLHKDNAPILLTVLFRLVRGWTPHVNVAFIRGPNEILNIVIEPMTAEPSPEVSEHLFRLHAQQVGYVDMGNHCLVVSRYRQSLRRYDRHRRDAARGGVHTSIRVGEWL